MAREVIGDNIWHNFQCSAKHSPWVPPYAGERGARLTADVDFVFHVALSTS